MATSGFLALLWPEVIKSARECCLEVDRAWDSFWGGLAISEEVDHSVAGKGFRKTLDQRVTH